MKFDSFQANNSSENMLHNENLYLLQDKNNKKDFFLHLQNLILLNLEDNYMIQMNILFLEH